MIVLIPTVGMVGFAASSARQRWSSSERAVVIRGYADSIGALTVARIAVMSENLESSALALAADNGVTADRLTEMFGVDHVAALAEARSRVDGNRLIRTDDVLSADLRSLRALRSRVDRGEASIDVVIAQFAAVTSHVEQMWETADDHLEAALGGVTVGWAVRSRADVLRWSYEAFKASLAVGGSAIAVTSGSTDLATVRSLGDDRTRVAMALSAIRNTGPRASAALRAFERDPASGRFEAFIEQLVADGWTGTTSPTSTDLMAIGAALTDGVVWIDRLTMLVGAAAADLGTAASASAAANVRGFRLEVLVASLVTLVSSLAVAALARSIARPLRRIAGAARAVHDGSFDLPALEASGPRELADAAVAINEMALTLGAVESRALALTGATDARTAFAPLPGRTGRALDAALDQLYDLAAHDGLTALLNRNAALDAIGRDFARGRRDGQPVMALFLDLDELKAINDVHGHSTGDAAIAFVADVLGRVCRDSDVVARVGGDEFLIAGLAPGGRNEAEALAERIRTEMRATMMRVGDVEIPVQCSVGVAIADPLSSSVEALLADADAAMYRAKAAGRAA